MMNAIQISVKTNTVLVCKDLAEAQFRCMGCSKAFISERHLVNHNQKRHGVAPYFTAGIQQINPLSDSERKLNEVAGRLEKALSFLEAKTTSLDSSTSHDRPENTVRENVQVANAQSRDRELELSPRKSLDVRRTVSLFTLPRDRYCEPIVDGWMTKSAQGRSRIGDCENADEESLQKKSTSTDYTQHVSIPDDPEVEQTILDEAHDHSHQVTKSTQAEIPEVVTEDSGSDHRKTSIEPLLLNLIQKLDTVFTGNRVVMNSGCQTSEPVESEPKTNENCLPDTRRKSVRFSDLPMYYGNPEQQFNQTESECSSRSSGSNFDDRDERFVENDDIHQTYTNYSAQSHVTRPVFHAANSGEIAFDPEAERTRILESCSGRNEVDASGDSCQSPDELPDVEQNVPAEEETLQETESCTDKDETEDDCSRSRETTIPGATSELPPESYDRPADAESRIRKSADFVATRKQILDIVEKCVKDLKAKRKPPQSAPTDNRSPSQIQGCTNHNEQRISDSDIVKEIAIHEQPELKKTPNSKTTSSRVICAGNGAITVDSQGILPPCTVMCKDEEVDLDEFSGDSYERFMKKYHFRKPQSEQGRTQQPSKHDRRDDVERHEYCEERLPECIGTHDVKAKDDLDMKKTEYAMLLHHETSQVQALIDTLVSDLQRWRNAKRDHLSRSIRLQLEERLAANLNLLGIQSNARLLSDSAAATAQFLLSNRRSKLAKGSPSSYFEVLKYAFVNEVDRIAKSRVNSRNPAL